MLEKLWKELIKVKSSFADPGGVDQDPNQTSRKKNPDLIPTSRKKKPDPKRKSRSGSDLSPNMDPDPQPLEVHYMWESYPEGAI